MVTESMDTYIITRSCYTGVNEYRYFREYRQIGRAQAFVLPGFPVAVSWGEQAFTCRREQNLLQNSGGRSLFDSRNDREFACVSRTGPGRYGISAPSGELEVEYQDGIYVFDRNGRCVAGLGPVQKGSPFDLAHPEWETPDRELYMAMMAAEELREEQAVLMLSFPLLRPDP